MTKKTNPNSRTANAVRTLFGNRAAAQILKTFEGSPRRILDESRATYGNGWDLIRAVRDLNEEAFIEQPSEHALSAPSLALEFLKHALAGLGHEIFAVAFLDAQNRPIAFEQIHRGSLTQTSVYPREIVRRALLLNSASCLLLHNHPSGIADPSRADQVLTRELQSALKLVDVQVLDHIIIAGDRHFSFAEGGLL